MRAQPAGSHYIGGRFVDSSGPALESRFAATQELIASLHEADPATIDAAVGAARAGARVWAATPWAERGRVLRAAAALVRQRNHELSVLETLDTGKPLQETLVADAASGADCLEYFGSLAATVTGEYVDLGGSFTYTRREPLGVCVGIGAWNYPIQIACWKAAPALAAGNAMVFKPSEVTPLSALALAEILTEAGLPAGVFNVVQGGGSVGAALVEHPDVAKVSVTGSVATGERVAAGAAAGLKHVTLELGGKSPLIVFDDADLDNAVSGAMLGNFYSTGQICSNGTRVFVRSQRPRRVRPAARRPHGSDRPRGPARRVHADGAARQRAPVPQRARLPPTRRSTRERESPPGARPPTSRGCRTAGSCSRRSSPTSTTRCGSPERRSSGP